MKTKVYLEYMTTASGKPQVCVRPVVREDEPEEAVISEVLTYLEDKLGAVRAETLEGLDQTYVDYVCGSIQFTLRLDPWFFIALTILDEPFRKKVFDAFTELFEVVPKPPQDGDDE